MLKLYNTLTRKIEEFAPIINPTVGMYSCGPTVYDYQHIGHMRRYVGDDILLRVLEYNGYKVNHIMNITDVGHLVSDSDTGEDKMEKGAKKFGKSVWEIAKMFEEQFWQSMDSLDIKRPNKVMHATDYIKEQIALIEILEKKGFTYKIADGIYFDSSKFKDYFAFSRQNPAELKKGARVDFVEGKKNIADFALWKFSPSGEKRQMEWESPWGIGFPGWHIECSAMSMKALGETFDIHTGGIDHINIHHTNEIAQSEGATGKKFVNYWVHHNFLVVEGQKMSKSLGNFYTVQDVIKKGFDPMALRYLYLQTHYRQEMNFTWESLEAAQTALHDIYKNHAIVFGGYEQTEGTERDPSESVRKAWDNFQDAINDDLNTPKALAALHTGLKEARDNFDEIFLLSKADPILGLKFKEIGAKKYNEPEIDVPQSILDLVRKREGFRKAGDFAASDEMREKIDSLGYTISDTKEGPKVTKKQYG